MATEPRVVYLSWEQLLPDPDNPRRFYPPEDVAAMAESIQDGGGVEVPLLVQQTPATGGMYLVIDGHFRLAGAQALGSAAPLLKCEVRSGLSRRDTLLIMARTSALWFEKDPISEGLHYRKLVDGVDGAPGMSVSALARAVGRSEPLVTGRLRLLDLDPEIQEHVAAGRLPRDRKVADALLSIEDRRARLRLADELARRQASLRGVISACEHLRASLGARRQPRAKGPARLTPRSLEIAGASVAPPAMDARGLPALARPAAAAACAACDIHAEVLGHVPEPAWALFSHAAGETCANCNLAAVHDACGGCPLPEFLVRLSKAAAAPPVPVAVVRSGNGHHPKGDRR